MLHLDFGVKMEQNILTFNDILFLHLTPVLYIRQVKKVFKNGMLYVCYQNKSFQFSLY